eukprot:gnl/TRDRNA2_/TRDRNA2_181923_c0_seq1.p1 gnl/TRDRNA2_/TRDRNA2_181923_c0~~gnl/TRDRNA2_/TRDRNA2_181923_c0_seq1.p1  ORF type:complete len:290 (-),score=68.12 gnl/TRDRNA2_/TRDRNA2_181923_c0_seq1:82-858(-)
MGKTVGSFAKKVSAKVAMKVVKRKTIRQQRWGIRLHKRGKKGAKTGASEWLVPPSQMANKLGASKKETKTIACSWQTGALVDGKLQVTQQEKQSGVYGVWYHPTSRCWVAKWYNSRKKVVQKYFSVKDYQAKGYSMKNAEDKALKEAIKCRQSMVNSGACTVINQNGRRAERISGIKGVTWHKLQNCWTVRIVVQQKTIRAGRFSAVNDSEDAIEEARVAAVKARKRVEEKFFNIRTRGALEKAMKAHKLEMAKLKNA